MNDEPCNDCGEPAVWFYPGERRNWRYCDEHVPRNGCSCNVGDYGELMKDEQGRDLPCVDWMYFPRNQSGNKPGNEE